MANATAAAPSRTPQAVVILAPGVSGEALFHTVTEPRWDRLRSECAFGLVSASVPGPDTLESAQLTIGAGRRLQWAPGVSPEADAGALLREPPTTGARVIVLAPTPADLDRPDPLLTHAPAFEPLPEGIAAQASLAAELVRRYELLLVVLPPGTGAAGALEMVDAVSQRLDRTSDLVLLTSPNPDTAPGGEFRHLAPLLLWGRQWPGSSATSSTTRTPGLVSNTDLAPTVLAHFGLAPTPTMEGHAIRPASVSLDEVRRYERHIRATGIATVPVLMGWGALSFLAVAWILWRLRDRPSSRQILLGRSALAMIAGAPAAMLLVAGADVSSPWAMAGQVLLGTLALGSVATTVARRWPPVLKVFTALVALLMFDLCTGGRMLARCLLGDFVNTGVRFYGMGNEYEGLMLGAAVLLPFSAQAVLEPEAATFRRAGALIAALLWPLTLVAVASPALGADFGGALSLSLACALGIWLGTGRKLRPGQLAVGALLLVVVGIGVAALDLMRPPELRSHVGELAAQVVKSGGGRLVEVLGRKAAMNLRMATTPYSLVGLAAVAALGGICYHLLAARVRQAVAARPLLRSGTLATLAGAATALALNDSGIVAGGLAVGCVLLLWLDILLQDASSPKSSITDLKS